MAFGLNVNADAGVFGSDIETGVAQYTADFIITGHNYDLTLTVHRAGALRRSADDFNCSGSMSLGDMPAPSLTVNDVPGDSLSALALPGVSIDAGGGDADQAVPDMTASQILQFRNRTSDHFVLTFGMSAVAFSHSCEVSARLGAQNGGTAGCNACVYPGDGNRDITADGLFVEVAIRDLCGDGASQFPEQCDLANLNGDPSSCCNFDCTFKQPDRICRPATGPCDQAEACTGTDRSCPFDRKAPADSPCTDDGNPCTVDQCDGGGQCRHTRVPDPCPALCGNGRVDPGEFCDLGPGLNGADTTCCDATCMIRPDNAPCTDHVFCNGPEGCAGGMCGGSKGNPCTMLGACAVCDEAHSACDTSACPPTPIVTPAPTPSPTPTILGGHCDPDQFKETDNVNGAGCIFCTSRDTASCQVVCFAPSVCFCPILPGHDECCQANPCCQGCSEAGSLQCTLAKCACTPDDPSCCATHCPCAGDCNGNGAVTPDELVLGVGIALGQESVDACFSLDTDGSGSVEVNEINTAVNGCPP